MNKRFIGPFWSYLLSFAYIAFFYKDLLLTNESFPGGDAKRALSYADLAAGSSKYFSLWEPYSALGRPFFSDPELVFYWQYAQFTNLFDRQYYPIVFNLSLLFALLLLLWTIRAFFKAFGVREKTALMMATLTCCSVLVSPMIESGRLNSLVGFSAAVALVPVYRVYLFERVTSALGVILLSVLSSIALMILSYYILIPYTMLWIYVCSVNFEANSSNMVAILKSTGTVALVGLASLLLSAVYFFPLLEHQLALVGNQGWGKNFAALQAASAFRIFIPFASEQEDLTQVFPYVSPVLIVGVFGYFTLFRKASPKRYLPIWFWGIFCVLAAVVFADSSRLGELYQLIPVVNLLRWGSSYASYGLLILACITCLKLDRLSRDVKVPTLYVNIVWITLCCVYISISWFFTPFFALSNMTLGALCISGVLFLIMNRKLKSISAGGVLLLFALTFQLLLPESAFYAQRSSKLTARISDTQEHNWAEGRYGETLIGERQYCGNMHSCPSRGGELVGGLNGFSMYFSKSAKKIMGSVYGQNINVSRPHWIKRSPCNNLQSEALKFASVNYLYCKRREKPPSDNWEELAMKKGWVLWGANKKTEPFRLYDYSLVSSKDQQFENRIERFVDRGVVYSGSENSVVESVRGQNDHYEIKVTNYGEKAIMLMTSFQFNDNWKVTNGGNELKTVKLLDQYLGVKLQEHKEYSLRLSFVSASFGVGMWVSLAMLIILLSFALVERYFSMKSVTRRHGERRRILKELRT